MANVEKKASLPMVQDLRRTKILLKVWRFNAKNEILTAQYKQLAYIDNKKNRSLYIKIWKR